MNYLRNLHDKFVEIVAHRLHYFEMAEGKDLTEMSYSELMEMQEGWLGRYENDMVFRNKVLSTVAPLLEVTSKEIEQLRNEWSESQRMS